MKKILLFLFLILFLSVEGASCFLAIPSQTTSTGTDNVWSGDNTFSNGISFESLSFPPAISTQYLQYVYGGALYFRAAESNLAVAVSDSLHDTSTFVQASTSDEAYLSFATYWTGATVTSDNDYFLLTHDRSGAAQKTLFFTNTQTPYVFDTSEVPINLSFVVRFSEPGMQSATATDGLIIFTSEGGAKTIQIAATRDASGNLGVWKFTVFDGGLLNLTTAVDVEPDVDYVVDIELNGTVWQATVDGVIIGQSTDIRDGGGAGDTMALTTDFEDWTGAVNKVQIGLQASRSGAIAGTTEIRLGGIAVTPTP